MKKVWLLFTNLLLLYLIVGSSSTWAQPASSGNSLYFPGDVSYVGVGNLSFGGKNQLSISAWITNIKPSGYGTIIAKYQGGGGVGEFIFRVIDKKVMLTLHINGAFQSVSGNTVLNDGIPYHIVGTYDNSTMKIYVNGVLDGTFNQTGSITSVTSINTYIGILNNNSEPYQGTIDELSLWDKALSECEIAELKNNKPHILTQNLVAYYDFEHSSGTLLPDLTGHFNGNLSGNPTWAVGIADFIGHMPALTGTSAISETAATLHGITQSSTATEYGVVYNTLSCTNLTNSSKMESTNLSSNLFSVDLSGLAVGTSYIARPYAIEGSDTIYGNEVAFNTSMPESGNSLAFDGSNDYVTIPSNQSVSNNFTYEFWVKPTSTQINDAESNTGTDGVTAGKRYALFPNSTQAAGVSVGTNGVSVYEHASGYMPPIAVYSTSISEWTHVAVVYQNRRPHIYLNGVLKHIGLQSSYSTIYPDISTIGGSTYGYFKGSIDEVRIWNYARTECQIASEYTKKLSGNEDGLLAYYDFDQKTGSILNELSPNKKNGSLVSFNQNGYSSGWVASGAQINEKLTVVAKTRAASGISLGKATMIGEVLSGTATEYGFVFGTDACVTLANGQKQIAEDLSSGIFTAELTGLSAGTVYYARAYATNEEGTSYGIPVTLYPGAGNAMAFDGINDYLTSGYKVIPETGDYSVSVWAKNTAPLTGYREIMAQGANFYLGFAGTALRIGDSWSIPGIFPTDNMWHNYTVVKTATDGFLYIDGVLVATKGSALPGGSAAYLLIGNQYNYGNEYWQGEIDEVRVFTSALADTEVADLCNRTLYGTEAYLNLYYDFNEGIPCGNNLAASVVLDKTGSYQAICQNMALTEGNCTSNFIPSTAANPRISAFTVAEVDATSFSALSTISSTGWSTEITTRGFVYSTSPNPTLANEVVKEEGAFGAESYNMVIDNLERGTLYFVRAFATSENGTIYSSEKTISVGRVAGSALILDGTDDYGYQNYFNPALLQKSFTIEFWTKPTVLNKTHYAVVHGNVGDIDKLLHIGFNASNQFCMNFYGDDFTSTATTDLNWHHWAATYDMNTKTQSVYKDGVLVGTRTANANYAGTSQYLLLGYYVPSGIPYGGSIDELRIWDNARTACEIESNYKKSLKGVEPGLISYYDFNGSTGTVVNDKSGNSINLDLTGLNNTAASGWVSSEALINHQVDAYVATGIESDVTQDGATISGSLLVGTATEYGIVYNISGCATISGNKAISTNLSGTEFTAKITGLQPATWYRARAYATNANGTVYGKEMLFSTAWPGAGNALAFDGTDDMITLKSIYNFPNNFSFEFWVKPNKEHTVVAEGTLGIDGQQIVIYDNSLYGTIVSAGTNGVQVYTASATGFANIASYQGEIKDWTHIAIVFTDKIPSIYLNGQLVHTGIKTTNPFVYPSIEYIGGFGYSMDFEGELDEIRIWDRSLNQTEIEKNMSLEISGKPNGLLGYYTMNQGTNCGNNIDIAFLYDKIAGRHGVFTNMALSGGNCTSNFVKSTLDVPILEKTEVITKSFSSAEIKGNIAVIGFGEPVARGICYAIHATPTVEDSVEVITGAVVTGEFTANLSKLTPETNYYARAFVTVGAYTFYSNQVRFVTNEGLPDGEFYSPGSIVANIYQTEVRLISTFEGEEVTYTISPALPTGLSLNLHTGEISGTVKEVGTTVYTVSITNVSGTTETPVTITGVMPEVFDGDLFSSKAYYSDYVQLKWELIHYDEFIKDFYIYRKTLGSKSDSVRVATVPANLRTWRDEFAASNVLYEYTVVARYTFTLPVEVVKNVNYVAGVGFRIPTGTVSGKVTYAGGNAVEGVRVIAETEDDFNGKSIRLNGTDSYLEVPVAKADADFGFENNFVFQAWFMPENATLSALFEKGDDYKITREQGEVNFTAGEQVVTLNFPEKVDTFFNVTAMRNADSLLLMVFYNYKEYYIKSVKFTSTTPVNDSSIVIGKSKLGQFYKGYINEIRIWQKSFTREELLASVDAFIMGSDVGLSAYYRLNENFGNVFYDRSGRNFVFNENHGLVRNSEWASLIPNRNQLGVKGITDDKGKYIIAGIPFATAGSVYRFVPVYEVHEFNPSDETRFIGPEVTTHNNVDFIDIASFKIRGNITYKDTYFPVKGVQFYIDDQIVVQSNGMPVSSDDYGNYEITVPIGNHFIEVGMNGHVFRNARFPNDGNYNFQKSISGLDFIDTTLVKVIGRVTGGPREASKLKGLGHTLNNLGNATINLTSQKGYDLSDKVNGVDTIFKNFIYQNELKVSKGETKYSVAKDSPKLVSLNPDPVTGEFIAYLLPEKYLITGITAGDYIYDNSYHTTIDLTMGTLLNYTEKDTIVLSKTVDIYGDTISVLRIDSVEYNQNMDLIYRSKPSIAVTRNDGEPMFWETEIWAKNDSLVSLINEDGTLKTAYPVMLQRGTYKLKISVFEPYTNSDTDIDDFVPVSDGKVEIQNFLAIDQEKHEYDINDDGTVLYRFSGGMPNITTGGIGDYLLSMTIVAHTGQNNSIATEWLPNGEKFKSYILGGMPTGSNFVTTGPNELVTILRDPPGSASYSYLEKGASFSSSKSYDFDFGVSAGIALEVELGVKVVTFAGIGVGVITEAGATNNFEIGTQASYNYTSNETMSQNITTTQTWSTSDSEDFVGADGDVFVGYATNIVYGLSRQVGVMPDTTSQGECFTGLTFEDKGVTYDIGLVNGLRVNPEYGTMFMYTQNHIENYLIPNLITLRNSLLLANTDVYKCVICDPENEDFGSSNTTGNNTANGYEGGDSYNVVIPADWDTKYVYTDSVAMYNQQIQQWIHYLALNEEEKYKSILEENLSFDGGTSYEKSVSISSAIDRSFSHSFAIETSLSQELGFEIMGMGSTVKMNLSTSSGKTNSQGTTEENSTTYGYSLSDGNEGDYISVDVKKPVSRQKNRFRVSPSSPDSIDMVSAYGPVFITRGGQTSCPFEGGTFTKYYNRGRALNTATMQREMPEISCSNPIVANVPADLPAIFNFQLSNASETNEDLWLMLYIDETSNQNGALLEMDGSPIGNGRLILVPAGTTINKVISMKQIQPNIYDYTDITIGLGSLCDDISDEVKISAYFQPVCTSLNMSIPENQWIVNTNTDTTLTINISNYNLAHQSFDKILFQYKSTSTSNWATDMIFYVNEDDYNAANEPKMFINSKPSLNYLFNLTSLQDRNYDLKVVSSCVDGTTNNSVIASGIKDVKRPQVFGTPQPGDGILAANDDILISFDEPIFDGGLLPNNFSVRGVLNGNTIRHQACLYFDGISAYASAVNGINLDNKSWTIEFWARRGATTEGVIFAQNGIEIGFNSDNKFYSKTGTQLIVSEDTYTDTDAWIHFAVTYNYATKKFDMFVNDKIVRESVLQTSAFNANGRMTLGKSVSSTKLFNGFVHELRIWEKALSFGTVYAQMYQILVGNNEGLSGYWPMDEAQGISSIDKARNRDAYLFNAQWRVFPNGHARVFDGANASVSMNTASSVVITNDMNFTLEFYFKGGSQTNTVLFSNGKADGTDVTPAFKNIWLVGFNENGKLYALNNGINLTLSEDFADNKWHHFALTVNRNANAQILINGEVKAYQQSTNFGGLLGSYMTLGARRHYADMIATFDRNFNGMIDEVRIWNLAKTRKQILLDMNCKLKGDEMGLLAYYPFDKYDNLGADLIETLEDISGKATNAIATGGTSTHTDVPSIKDARPVQNVAFDWVVNEDKIVININEPASLIEKCMLEFTVERIEDLQENRIASPVTWSAYIKKNNVVWDDFELNIQKEVFAEYEFEAKIINLGGTEQTYSITGLPSWLTCNQASGSLAPDSYTTLKFTVDPVLNVGNYELALYLTADFGYSEKLNLTVNVVKPAPDWTINSSEFQYSSSLIGELKIDGEFSTNKNDILAAFVNGECRGIAYNKYVPEYDKYEVFLNIYSNVQSGETVNFKIWNATEGYEHTNVTPILTFMYNDMVGSPSVPQLVETNNSYNFVQNLEPGWSWISFNLKNTNLSNVNEVMATIDAQTGDQIKSQTAFANYSESSGWDGSLSDAGGFNNKSLYMLKLAKKNVLTYWGVKVNVQEETIPVNTGWNWISYTSNKNMKVEDAFTNYNALVGDVIKSQFQFAMYDAALGWVGSLTYLVPGMGYMLKTENTAGSFTYPVSSNMKASIEGNGYEPVSGTPWTLHESDYQFTMSLVASIKAEADLQLSQNLAIAAFDGNVCRGIAKSINLNAENLFFATIHGDTARALSFKVYDLDKQTIYEVSEKIGFAPNAIAGTLESPIVFTILKTTTGINELKAGISIETYPNPFTDKLMITYSIPTSGNVSIEIFNELGHKIQVIADEFITAGTHKAGIDGSQLSTGVYMIRITTDTYTETMQVIKQ